MLPAGWTEHFSKSKQRPYYVSCEGKTQWEFPCENLETSSVLERIKHFYLSFQQPECSFLNILKHFFFDEVIYDLLSDYVEDFKFSVLDLGCGSGIDLGKWNRLGATSYHGMDSSDTCIKTLLSRDIFNLSTKVTCTCADFTQRETWKGIKKKFDVISLQYSINYAFYSRKSAANLFLGMSAALSSRGRILITAKDTNENDFECIDPKSDPTSWKTPANLIHELSSESNLEVGLQLNLATFACFLGICTARSGLTRKSNFVERHEHLLKRTFTDIIPSSAWNRASKYSIFVLRPINSCVAKGLQNEIEQWSNAQEIGMLDALG